MTEQPWRPRLLIRGAGLMGASVGLAARRAGATVVLSDPDPARLELACSLGAGDPLPEGRQPPAGSFDLVVVATPPAACGAVAAADLRAGIADTVTHLCSVQVTPQREVEASGAPIGRFVGGHPIAGRELPGPLHASADLFADRPWIVCPTAATEDSATAAVAALARATGARPIRLDAASHDELFARLSHVPQLVASALAATLDGLPAEHVAVSGPGLRDTTRIADSPAAMWAEIAAANARPTSAGLRAVAADLMRVAAALGEGEAAATAAVHDLLERGRRGRALLPGKHGGRPVARAEVQVVVPDQPGALADLLAAVAAERVNLEDLRVEHAPGQAAGTALLAVDPAAQERLISALRDRGWDTAAGPTIAG